MSTEQTPATSLSSAASPSDLGAIFEASTEAHQPCVINVERGDGQHAGLLLVPRGMRVEDTKPLLDARRAVPECMSGTSTHETLDSLIRHAQEFKRPNSAAWCSIAISGASVSASVLVIYDYHHGNTAPAPDCGAPGLLNDGARWCRFGASYSFPTAREFKAWLDVSGKAMSQAEMAAFLEDHLGDVASPEDAGPRANALAQLLEVQLSSASSLLGFSRRSAATVSMYVAEKRDPTTGAVSLIYQEEVNHQTEDRVVTAPPSVFAITVPVLEGGAAYRLPVRIKAAVKGRGVTWTFEVYRLDQAAKTAVDEEVARFAAETGIAVYRGCYVQK